MSRKNRQPPEAVSPEKRRRYWFGKLMSGGGFVFYLAYIDSMDPDLHVWGWIGFWMLIGGVTLSCFARPDPVLRQRRWWIWPVVCEFAGLVILCLCRLDLRPSCL